MSQVESRRVLIPQYSVRWLLAITTVCGVIFSIVALGLRGHTWATGVSIGILSLVVLAFVYALVFAVAWLFSLIVSLVGRGPRGPGRSPFRNLSVRGVDPVAGKDVPATPILLE